MGELFVLDNQTSEELKISTFESGNKSQYQRSALSQFLLIRVDAVGGDFGAIADFDSIMFEQKKGNSIKWFKPNNLYGFVDEDNNIGKDRGYAFKDC